MATLRKPKAAPKIIKPIRRNTDTEFKEAWETLSTAIIEIYRKNASSLSFEELYRNAYNMVLHKQGDKLYNGVEGVIRDHLCSTTTDNVVPKFPKIQQASSTSNTSSPANPGADSGSAGGNIIMVGGQEYLKALKAVWDDHTTCMVMIRDILLYMDRVYVKTANKPLVYDMGLDVFRDHILFSKDYPIREQTTNTLLNQILLEREGEIIDRHTIKSVVDMLLSLTPGPQPKGASLSSVYEAVFEQAFLESSKAFYALESETLLRTCDARDFLMRVEQRLEEEERRTQHCLSMKTEPKIRGILEETLISKNVKAVIDMENSGLLKMLSNDRTDDLRRMFTLFGRVPNGHKEMRSTISSYIRSVGKNINESFGGVGSNTSSAPSVSSDAASTALGNAVPANPIKWVEELLGLRDKFDKLLEVSFSKDKAFVNEVNAAMGVIINANLRGPEYISLFIDDNLKKGVKGKSEQEIDALLDKTVVLFRLIEEKDVFERYYKQHLAKRLLYGRSASEEAERSFIAKLKVECGNQFTQKLEGMFNDMRTSDDTNNAFKTQLERSGAADTADHPDIHVSVLTSTYWPTSTAVACLWPETINKIIQRFERFYLSRHSGRRLSWMGQMGTADMKAVFPKGKKEINISTFGMVVLMMCFNDQGGAANEVMEVGSSSSSSSSSAPWVPFTKIQEVTGIPAPELRRTLQSLSLAKYKVLNKKTKGKEVAEDEEFRFNLDFSAPLNKIKILTISGGASGASGAENDQERNETREKIDEARKHIVEAAIVRIMKGRKRMDHNNLVVEVIGQLTSKFAPSAAMVKKRIEGLIEREYLERDSKDRKFYNYLA
ncbi:hypothetical protein HDV05_008132 [Chytridiales sp. JEL 0842]|nr:hypothetical protein HDV05_008132 [Chytridiales sp. JEL 0842]